MRNVTATATGGEQSYAISLVGCPTGAVMSNVTASASGASVMSVAVFSNNSTVSMNNVTLTTLGQVGQNIGIYHIGQDLSITNSSVTSSGFALLFDQWYLGDVTIDHSTIKGGSWSISNFGSFPVFIGASKLVGGIAGAGVVCVASFNSNYAPLDATCQ